MKALKRNIISFFLSVLFFFSVISFFFQSRTDAEETYWAGCINSDINYYVKARLELNGGTFSGELRLLKYDLHFPIQGPVSGGNVISFSINFFELDKPEFSAVVKEKIIEGTVKGRLLNGKFWLRKYEKLPSVPSESILGWYKMPSGNDMLLTLGGNSELSLVDFKNDKQFWLMPESDSIYFELAKNANSPNSLTILDHNSGPKIKWNEGSGTSLLIKVQDSYRQKLIRFTRDETMISGMLHYRDIGKKLPLIVLIQGSGSAVKDDYYYLQIAEYFIDKGFAVFLSDKRGSGESSGSWHNSSYNELALDVSAAVDELIKNPVIDIKNIIIFGFSQGGVIAPIASKLNSNISLVINCMGTATTATEQEMFDIENECGKSDYDMKKTGEIELLYSKLFEYARTSQNWSEYHKLVLSAAAKQWYVCAGFPPLDSNDWRIKFWKANVNSDGAEAWKTVSVPSLVIYGEEDTNVPTFRSEKILNGLIKEHGKKNIELKLYEELGHIITKEQLDFIFYWITKKLQK